MLIICDDRLPDDLKDNLGKYGEVMPFLSRGIVYDAIAGHPDIFFHRTGGQLIHAPQTPAVFIEKLESTGITLIQGEKELGKKYPQTVYYNAVATANKLFCNEKYIDKSILEAHKNKEIVHVNQGYTACNLIVGEKTMLSSDKGICKVTGASYFDPSEIILSGVNHGFIGGSCSIAEDKLFLFGSLDKVSGSSVIQHFAEENHLKIIELYNGPLTDGGGLVVI